MTVNTFVFPTTYGEITEYFIINCDITYRFIGHTLYQIEEFPSYSYLFLRAFIMIWH